MLTEQRTAVKDTLTNGSGKPAGFRAYEYVGEVLGAPCAAIVPAEPYVRVPSRNEGIPFGRLLVRMDVLLISAREDAKQAAKLTDDLIEYAYRVLRAADYTVQGVSRPGVITVSDAKYIGSVLTIEQLTEEP